ncbi:MAG: radical SAM family heme chaperone HemW [Chloracidobacterium sp.]|uniref:Heme chaperone HemW n=1 Tax=Chloracidobacterium validum TaxID=2821543 RepID=A0ABX8BA65_9BACT|nr:radical SAM family heme chaperone HemW [Chloracidobacterium validum]QUW03818.1 radical SAM family heme chaperone HemW [Chloracidobacterium validum]
MASTSHIGSLGDAPQTMPRIGVYVHFPFCVTKCTYCAFVTRSYDHVLAERYVRALEQELRHFAEACATVPLAFPTRQADTLYVGGGTPSRLTPSQLARVLQSCRATFDFAPDTEVTLEINPGDAQPDRLEAYRALGVTRLSLGVQSFSDRDLALTGRDHSAQAAKRAFQAARNAGFDNISLDLIAGLPEQTLSDWRANLTEALALEPEHLSLYLLEVKAQTTLARQLATGRLPALDEDAAAEMYLVLLETLTQAGFDAYEISNFARPGYRARHNLKYWTDVPYAAFGVGAHGYDGDERYWNSERLEDYCSQIEQRHHAVITRTQRSAHDRWHEELMLGLRLDEGVAVAPLCAKHGIDLSAYRLVLDDLQAAGLVVITPDRLRLTIRGRLLSNEVFLAFL